MFRTYRALADTIGTSWHAGEGFVVASSANQHPLLNFAFAHQLTAYSAREMAESISLDSANVYCLETDTKAHALLVRNGFHLAFSMGNLTAPPMIDGAITLELFAPENRRAIAEFMVGQFFNRRDAGYQDVFCQAMTGAESLALVATKTQNRISAAALVSPVVEHEPVGIFNFCVDGRHQRKGLGTQFVSTLRAQLPRSSVGAQCVPEMIHWYQNRGFGLTETIHAFRNSG